MIEYPVSQSEPPSRSGMLEFVSGFESSQATAFGFEDGAINCDVAWTFGSYLAAMIDRAGIDRAEFARRAHIERGHVTNLVKDRRSPNMDDVDRWADILGLRGEDRELFKDLAVMRHIPAVARDRYLTFVELVDEVRRERAVREAGPTPREG